MTTKNKRHMEDTPAGKWVAYRMAWIMTLCWASCNPIWRHLWSNPCVTHFSATGTLSLDFGSVYCRNLPRTLLTFSVKGLAHLLPFASIYCGVILLSLIARSTDNATSNPCDNVTCNPSDNDHWYVVHSYNSRNSVKVKCEKRMLPILYRLQLLKFGQFYFLLFQM